MNSNEKFHATPEEIHHAFDEGHAVRYFFSSDPIAIFTNRFALPSIVVYGMRWL